MPSIFLSHSSKDNLIARRLAKALTENGVYVWIDEAEIKAGDRLLDKLNRALLDVDFLGVLLSPASVVSDWVLKEVEIAAAAIHSGRPVRIIPILIKDCMVPLCLQEYVYVDFRRRNQFDKSLRKLLDAVLPDGFSERILEVVRNAIQAEFAAYKQLPRVDLTEIDRWFDLEGSARARIVNLLEQEKEKGWTISNPGNPSTIEIIEIELKKIQSESATVVTEEYWYLRWFSLPENKYRFIYSQQNKQTYVLARDRIGNWRVSLNSYPVTPSQAGMDAIPAND